MPSSEWIADASMRGRSTGTRRRCCWSTCRTSTTTCSASGQTIRGSARTSRAIDAVCGRLIAHCRERGRRVIVLSEYGLVPTSAARCTSTACCARRACSRCATSSAPTRSTPARARRSRSPTTRSRTSTCANPARIAEVAGAAASGARRRAGARSRRSSARSASTTSAAASWWRSRRATLVHLLLLARRRRAPDYARTVDIHRKPGYDPAELFLDPALRAAEAATWPRRWRKKARLPLPDERDPARRVARAGLARPRHRLAGRRAGADLVAARRHSERDVSSRPTCAT